MAKPVVTHVVKCHGQLCQSGSEAYCEAVARSLNEQYQTDEYTVEQWRAE